MHPNDKICKIMHDEMKIRLCKGHYMLLPHEHMTNENVEWFSCKSNFCRHCVKNSKDNNLLCIACYKERKINGLPDAYFNDKEKLMSETQEKAHGSGCTYLDNCSIA